MAMSSGLEVWIHENEWDSVQEYVENNPEVVREPLERGQGSLLHHLCSIGSTPTGLIELVSRLHPEAILEPDNRYRDTPLHMACRNSVTSSAKVQFMLDLLTTDAEQEALLHRNTFGGTVLHSAANHNSVLSVLEALVRKQPKLLRVRSLEGTYPITALWNAYVQTIPGYMAVARVLEGSLDASESRSFERFWEKLLFLAKETAGAPDEDDALLHGILLSNGPQNCYQAALLLRPSACQYVDGDGNLPLHTLVMRRPYRLKERVVIEKTIEEYREAASVRNHLGETPLSLAIHNKLPWSQGTKLIAEAQPSQLCQRFGPWYPFQYAALVGGVEVDTIYELLRLQPDLVA